MSIALVVTAGALVSAGTYLLLQRVLTRIIVGFVLLAHGANLLLLAAGGRAGDPPFSAADGSVPDDVAEPLPQALALTAIVISFGMLVFLLALAHRSWALTGDDEVEDDVEDRRVSASIGGTDLRSDTPEDAEDVDPGDAVADRPHDDRSADPR
ncbi:Na(+)/H(+) antiporter subunit C [Ilumatobacter sp.]|uniref:Na(+)/H(+) antiporter subunit C n=1 Tax=Ilumatobacter sp. TaxID=1967498 RepID=UPI003B5263A7